MLNRPILFVSTTDPIRSRQFYEGVLELRFLADEAAALVFEVGGTPLRVQKVDELTPLNSTVLGWWVDDIRETVEALRSRGVNFEQYEGLPQDDLGVWEIPGVAKVAWFKDPDGNTLSLTEAQNAA